MTNIDSAGAIRLGEELELERLNPWLLDNVAGLASQSNQTQSKQPIVMQYSGGASNWTYCLRYPDRDIVLRRAPAGTKAKGAHDMGREFRLQAALKPVYPLVPNMLGFCDDTQIIGTDFYVMEKLNGLIPRKEMPKGVTLSVSDTRQLCTNVIDSLISLHQVDYQASGLDHLAKGSGYTQRQISGWIGRYQKAKTWNVPSASYVIDWLNSHLPAQETICLTHNDFRLDNLVLDADKPTEIIGVLDWELATLGDPLMDLGNSMAYWIQDDDDFYARGTRRQPTNLPGMLSRREVVEYYMDKTDSTVSDFTFYEVYGLFRLAGIVQQIYYRYHYKQTRNPAFKQFWMFVHYLMYRCRKAIKHPIYRT